MPSKDLHEVIEAVFRSRGQSILTSSRENRYLLLTREGETTAVGYGAADVPPTEGEVEMFVSMAGNDSASKMVFLAPIVPGKEARAVLQREKVSLWDRISLTLALGEAVLSEAGGGADLGPGSVPKEQPSLLLPSDQTAPSRSSRQPGPVVEVVDISSMLKGSRPEQGPMIPPEMDRPREVPSTTQDDLGAALSGIMDILGEMPGAIEGPSAPPKVEEGATEQTEGSKDGAWKGSLLAPVRVSAEDACTKAGAQVDPPLELVLVPHLLLDVRYSLRSGQLDPQERTGCLLLNVMNKQLDDIPSAISSEVCSLKEVWDGASRPAVIGGAGGLPEADGRALIMERLREESLTQDRLVRDSLMSTIYQEVTYSFDPSSFEVLRTERVMLPFWVRKSPEGAVEWSVDAFLGRYIPGNRPH